MSCSVLWLIRCPHLAHWRPHHRKVWCQLAILLVFHWKDLILLILGGSSKRAGAHTCQGPALPAAIGFSPDSIRENDLRWSSLPLLMDGTFEPLGSLSFARLTVSPPSASRPTNAWCRMNTPEVAVGMGYWVTSSIPVPHNEIAGDKPIRLGHLPFSEQT